MSTVHFKQTTTATPRAVRRRPYRLRPRPLRALRQQRGRGDLEVLLSSGPTEADVKEGSRGIWERLHYDWSDPEPRRPDDHRLQHVGRRVGPHLHVQAAPDGTTEVELVTVRDGKNLKGRMLGLVLGTVGKGNLEEGVQELGQGHRSPQRGHAGGLVQWASLRTPLRFPARCGRSLSGCPCCRGPEIVRLPTAPSTERE